MNKLLERDWKLKENNMKTRFPERVKELVDVDAPKLWNTLKNSVLQACDVVCVERREKKTMGIHGGEIRGLRSNTKKESGI